MALAWRGGAAGRSDNQLPQQSVSVCQAEPGQAWPSNAWTFESLSTMSCRDVTRAEALRPGSPGRHPLRRPEAGGRYATPRSAGGQTRAPAGRGGTEWGLWASAAVTQSQTPPLECTRVSLSSTSKHAFRGSALHSKCLGTLFLCSHLVTFCTSLE